MAQDDCTVSLLPAGQRDGHAGWDEHHEDHPLMGEFDHGLMKNGYNPDTTAWQVLHVLAFLTGGTTFIAGTLALFYPGWEFAAAMFYTIGSCGFLFVDVQEFFTFDGAVLRTNICMSMTGSFLYIVGSVGFFPNVAAWNPLIGIWGFVLGSSFIGWSQLWKTHRIGGGEHPAGFSIRNFRSLDALSAAGVELGAGLGAWCFFFGTLLYQNGPLEGAGSVLSLVLYIWLAGSVFFTFGGCCLGSRHFVMGVV